MTFTIRAPVDRPKNEWFALLRQLGSTAHTVRTGPDFHAQSFLLTSDPSNGILWSDAYP
jgi:hypothetical protein